MAKTGKMIESSDKPIFILGAHKSGTSLLRSLFDGHPDLQIIPIESHVLSLLDFNTVNPLRSQKMQSLESKGDYISHLHNILLAYHLSTDHRSDNSSVFIDSLNQIQDEACKIEIKEAILHIWDLILNYVQKESLSNRRIVEKSVEHFEYAAILKLVFPESYFIHIIRNPYDNLLALRKFKYTSNYPSLHELVNVIRDSFLHAENNLKIINNYIVLKYEDLCDNPEKIMHDLSSVLGLKYVDSLLNPTVRNSPWKGNSSKNITFNKIEKHFSGIKEISPIEAELINRRCENSMKLWEYELLHVAKYSYLFPNKNEKLKTYIRNRAAALFP